MDEIPQVLEENGRKLVFGEEMVMVYPNRFDMLQMASKMYEEYLYANIDHEEIEFGKWLEEEIKKEGENEGES